jgi:hypothetical protein
MCCRFILARGFLTNLKLLEIFAEDLMRKAL